MVSHGRVKRAKPLQIPKHSGVHCGHSSSASVVGNANVHTYTSMVYQLGTYNALLRNNIVENKCSVGCFTFDQVISCLVDHSIYIPW